MDPGGIYRKHATEASTNGVKALFFRPDNSGSALYRIIQPAHLLDKHKLAMVAVVQPKEEEERVHKALSVADVVISSRISSKRWATLLTVIK